MNSLTDNNFAPGRHRRGAFTLVEVMISIALVLLLMYGVSQVFKMSSDAVGANQAVSKIVRDHRSAQAVLSEDWRNCAKDSPLFLISSRIGYGGPGDRPSWVTGFHNVQEQRDNGNDDPTFVDGAQSNFLRFGASDRIPRLDRLSFFARGSYRRQTTPNSSTAALATSGEAYVWLGHLAVDNGTSQTYPERQFARDRMLGRTAVLLKNGVANNESPIVGQGGQNNAALWPFGFDARPFAVYSDVAPVTMDQFRVTADSFYDAGVANKSFPNYWFRAMDTDTSGNTALRYWCKPVLVRPVTPVELSSKAPIFITNCTQFVVEYAGDYLNQDPQTGLVKHGAQNLSVTNGQYDASNFDAADAVNPTDGSVVHGTTDGQIDYIVDKTAGNDPSKWVRRIRWYGLPRDVNEDGKIDINDVVPLADVMAANGIQVNGKATQASWEKDLPPAPPGNDYAALANTAAANFRYTCAWHNDAPPMIRILIKIDDPTGKLQDGQWYEYVLSR